MSKEMPMVIFVSCSKCSHCENFRGRTGEPSDSNPEWRNSYIRRILLNDTMNGLKCSRLINIHDGNFGADINNINEFIIYNMIPPNIKVTDDLFEQLMYDEVKIFGTSVLRTAIKRNIDNTIKIEIKIDGNENDIRCEKIKELVEKFFIWNLIPKELEDLLFFFRNPGDHNISDFITEELREDPIYDIIIEQYHSFIKNPFEYETLLKRRYDYTWFLNNFFPKRFRELEKFYPSWVLILPEEWGKGIGTNNTVFGKVMQCETNYIGHRYISRKIEQDNLDNMIKRYYQGKLFLRYEEILRDKSKRSLKQVKFAVNDDELNL